MNSALLLILTNARLKILRELKVDISETELKICHDIVCPDLELRDFCLKYIEAAETPDFQDCGPKQLVQKLCSMGDEYLSLRTSLARVVAATPHSADVDRLINVYNKLKTPDRASLSPNTIANYLHT